MNGADDVPCSHLGPRPSPLCPPSLVPPLQNGAGCKYRHALPPGYVFKTKKEREAEVALKTQEGSAAVNLEELIEEERRKLPTTGEETGGERKKKKQVIGSRSFQFCALESQCNKLPDSDSAKPNTMHPLRLLL